jgi:hypothetical protein
MRESGNELRRFYERKIITDKNKGDSKGTHPN